MTVYSAWENLQPCDRYYSAARQAVGRGEVLFNALPISIIGVKGFNDVLGIPVIPGTCTTCHDSPNVGNHSLKLPIDIGLSDASRRTPRPAALHLSSAMLLGNWCRPPIRARR